MAKENFLLEIEIEAEQWTIVISPTEWGLRIQKKNWTDWWKSVNQTFTIYKVETDSEK